MEAHGTHIDRPRFAPLVTEGLALTGCAGVSPPSVSIRKPRHSPKNRLRDDGRVSIPLRSLKMDPGALIY